MSFPGSQPPVYPLSREEFRRALASGHGRAKIHVARCGVGEFQDEVLAAATVCGVFDLQCNDAREDWLADLVLAAGVERDVVASPIPEESNDCLQRNRLLKELARREIAGARESLYASFRPRGWTTWDAAQEIIELDGDKGLQFVAREMARRISVEPNLSIDPWNFSAYDELSGEGAARERMEFLAREDPLVSSLLSRMDADSRGDAEVGRKDEHPLRSTRPRRSVDEVVGAIRSAPDWYSIGWVGHWARSAGGDELRRVLELLPVLEEPVSLAGALHCIGGATLPPLHPRVFELTRHADDLVRSRAARCLSKHAQHGVRICGLEALARGDLLVGLEILTRSTQVDDVEAIVSALRPIDDVDEQHGVCWCLLDILKESPEAAVPRLALYAYERNPCMSCRERALRWLIAQSALPSWIAEECAHDASTDIRRKVAGAPA